VTNWVPPIAAGLGIDIWHADGEPACSSKQVQIAPPERPGRKLRSTPDHARSTTLDCRVRFPNVRFDAASRSHERIRRAVLRYGQGSDGRRSARRSVLPAMRSIADSGSAGIPRHSQSLRSAVCGLRSAANVMCAGEAHPASLLLARVSCARNGTSGRVGTCPCEPDAGLTVDPSLTT